MAQDIFLTLTGIHGESQDAHYPNAIEVLTWDWSIYQQSKMHLGSGGGTSKCTVDDLIFDHYVDCASPNLVEYCLTGKHIPEAVLVMRKAGGQALGYLKIIMEDVIITRVSPAMFINMPLLREQINLSFTRIRHEYSIQNAQGGSAGTATANYDIKANKVT